MSIVQSSRIILGISILGFIMGLFFLIIRPSFVLLPEDAEFVGLTSDQFYALNVNLFRWAGLVMRSWGSFVLGASVAIASLAYYPYRRAERWSWVSLGIIGLVTFIPFTLVNIYLQSDFLFVIAGTAVLYFIALVATSKKFFHQLSIKPSIK